MTLRTTIATLLALASLAALGEVQPPVGAAISPGATPESTAPAVPPPALTNPDDITEIIIQAPEPRYVAPTRRDQIGRIWAPVFINGKGPFRLVLDTGASRSCVTARVAEALQLAPDPSAAIKLQAVTGSATVPTIRVNSVLIGDLLINDSKLPIIPDALGGADGILGNEGLVDQRVYIDFRNDLIIISRSHGRQAPAGFITVPFTLQRGRLLTVETRMGSVRAKGIIDTGGQVTVANLALRDALVRRTSVEIPTADRIQGVTAQIQEGEGRRVPAIKFGPMEMRTRRMTFADVRIFEYWKLTKEPALLIGMDALGLLDTLIIDYRRSELQMQLRDGA